MGKFLLMDEMIERVNRGEKILGFFLLDDEEIKILLIFFFCFGYVNFKDYGFSQEILKIQVELFIYKSCCIENIKRNVFNFKLNKILFVVIFFLILFVLVMKFL